MKYKLSSLIPNPSNNPEISQLGKPENDFLYDEYIMGKIGHPKTKHFLNKANRWIEDLRKLYPKKQDQAS